jgi:predicted amidohydrolase YtcJ
MQEPRDLVLCDATVRTVDDRDTVAQAVLVRGGRIAAVGREEHVRASAMRDAEVRRLGGRTVTPGFIDPHNHLSLSAFEPVSVDCSTPPLADLRALLARIGEGVSGRPSGQWIRAIGFAPMMVSEGRPPTRWELDEVAPDNPVFLLDLTCNAAYVNSRALHVAGISEHSSQPWGGQIVKDRDGRPDGTLLQAALNPLQTASWLAYATSDPERAVELVAAKMREYLSVGLTGICDAAVTTDAATLYARADEAGRLPFTVQQLHTADDFFGRPDLRRSDFLERVLGRETDRLRGGTMKIFTDHVFPDGLLMDRLHDGCRVHTGTGYYDRPEVREMATAARSMGVDTAIHAMGNCSVESVLGAYEAVRSMPGSDGALLRLEHAYVAEPAQAPRMADLGVDLVAKPGLVHSFGPLFWDAWRQPGQDHLAVIPIRSMIEAGVRVSFGSDAPAGTFRPAEVLWSAVTRQSWRGEAVNAEEAVTAEEALRCYTINSAHAAKRAHEEGSIEVGKRANLVVLDRDPVTCVSDSLRDLQVLVTMVDGEVVHEVGDQDGHP